MKLVASALGVAMLVALGAVAGGAQKIWIEKPAAKPAATSLVVAPLPSLAPLVKQAGPAVLTIMVESQARNVIDPRDPRAELFRRFGMPLESAPQKQSGEGTGFIIHPDGYALTNHHVIEGATKILVHVGNSKETVRATLIGDDPRADIALIKLDGPRKDWPALPLGDSDRLEVGDYVVAIGNPFGLSQTVSTGILSARGRRDIAPSGRRGLYDFLQTDASINPGNSGGPLLNLNGEVIGINSAINAAGQGIGFAIPINLVKAEIDQLKQNGRVERAYIGVNIREVTQDISKGMGLDKPRGALVVSVLDGSPGFKAGLKPGDVIIKFDGKPVEESSDLPLIASSAGVGRAVDVELIRDGESRSAKVKLAALPEDREERRFNPRASAGDDDEAPSRLGVRTQTLDDGLRKRLDVDAKAKGAVIVQVEPGSAAAEAGLAPGDLVTEVNRTAIQDAKAFSKAVEKIAPGSLVKMLVIREGSAQFLVFAKP